MFEFNHRTFLVSAIGLSLFVILLAFIFQSDDQANLNAAKKFKPHFYRDPSISLQKVRLKFFYAVPKDASAESDWRQVAEKIINDSSAFYKVQFRDSLQLTADLYPTPVLLSNETLYYDTQDTNHGNPHGLLRILPELENNFPDFLRVKDDEFRVLAILYQGVGASGTSGAILISKDLLADKPDYRSSVFCHELGHAFGLPDLYDLTDNIPYSNDIMGSGRFKPIHLTYLSQNLLKDLGVEQ